MTLPDFDNIIKLSVKLQNSTEVSMKKLITLLLSISLMFLMVGCGLQTTTLTTTTSTTSTSTTTSTSETTSTTTTLSMLETPASLSIVDNIVAFDTVSNATKYKLSISTQEGTFVGEYNVTNGFNLFLILAEGLYTFKIKSTAPGYQDSAYSDDYYFEISDPNKTLVLEGDGLNNLQYIRWLGRTFYSEVQEARYFYFTASGFEVAFYGTELKVTIKATNYSDPAHQAYIVALVDGDEDPTHGTTFIMNQSEGEYTIVSGLEYGLHTVKLLKRSEAIDSDTAVKKIETDGKFANAPVAKDFRIQFIAASSSTGYGNLGSSSVAKSSANSDGLRAFAYLTTYLLDSDISIFAASGWGVTRGWNTGGLLSETQNIPAAYEYVAIDVSQYVMTSAGKWNHSDYIPNVVVVNLGTNDFNASGYSSMSAANKLILETKFIDDYTEFVRLLNNHYPDAIIIVAYGLMGEANVLGGFTNQVVANANTLIGHTAVYSFLMEAAGTNSNPFGSNSHPNVGTSKNVASALALFISQLTGREIVNTMIS